MACDIRIAAEGASNGGLLVANMLTRYPELFGAIVIIAVLGVVLRALGEE